MVFGAVGHTNNMSVPLAFYQSVDQPTDLLSIGWWLGYLHKEYEARPTHVVLEVVCITLVLYFMFKHEAEPKDEEDALTEAVNPRTHT